VAICQNELFYVTDFSHHMWNGGGVKNL
jgi:hypothetical protein